MTDLKDMRAMMDENNEGNSTPAENQKKSSDREIVNEHVSPSGGSGGASSSKIESVEILAALGFGFTMLFYGFDAVNTFNTDPNVKVYDDDTTPKYSAWLISDPTMNSIELWLSGVILFITGIFEALNQKIMEANICTIYSAFWILSWYVSIVENNTNYLNQYGGELPTMDELAVFHLIFCIIAAFFAIGRLKEKKIKLACHAAFAVFLLFMVIFDFSKKKALLRIAGIFAFIDAIVWWYYALGTLINEGLGDIVPMF